MPDFQIRTEEQFKAFLIEQCRKVAHGSGITATIRCTFEGKEIAVYIANDEAFPAIDDLMQKAGFTSRL